MPGDDKTIASGLMAYEAAGLDDRTHLSTSRRAASAALMGVPMRRTMIGIYALGGFYSALGGVIYAFGALEIASGLMPSFALTALLFVVAPACEWPGSRSPAA